MVKVKLTVTVQADLMSWIDEEVEKGHFADRVTPFGGVSPPSPKRRAERGQKGKGEVEK